MSVILPGGRRLAIEVQHSPITDAAILAELDERFTEPAAGAARHYAVMSGQAHQESDPEIGKLLNQLRILRMQLALLPKHPPDVIRGLSG